MATAITPLPALNRTDVTFRTDVDNFFANLLPTFTVQINSSLIEIDAAVTSTTTSATLAQTYADAAAASVNVGAWVSGASYGKYVTAVSPANGLMYRAKNLTAGSTDPSVDTPNWERAIISLGAAAVGANSDITSLSSIVSMNGGQLGGFRNRVLNGDIRVSQRYGTTAQTPGAGVTYVIDQFQYASLQASKISVQQVVDAPEGFVTSMKLAVVAALSPAATDYFVVQQPIEANSIIDFQLGRPGAQVITISFWVKGSVAGTYSAAIGNSASNRSYVFTYPVTTSWVRVKATIQLDTAGTWPVGSTNTGMILRWDLGYGANYTGTANTWSATNIAKATGTVSLVANAAATLNITGVQVELGTVASAFETADYGTTLFRCQRYFLNHANRQSLLFNGDVTTGGNYYARVPYTQTMRTIPTLSNVNSIGNNGFAATPGTMNPQASFVQESRVASSSTVGAIYETTWWASAEL